jgi:hypothetical protein
MDPFKPLDTALQIILRMEEFLTFRQTDLIPCNARQFKEPLKLKFWRYRPVHLVHLTTDGSITIISTGQQIGVQRLPASPATPLLPKP